MVKFYKNIQKQLELPVKKVAGLIYNFVKMDFDEVVFFGSGCFRVTISHTCFRTCLASCQPDLFWKICVQ